MSDLKARIHSDLNTARKARDKVRTMVLSTTLSEIRNREIDVGKESTDEDVIQVVSKAIKQRKDSADQMREGGRPELAEKEESEAKVLNAYLPEALSEEEVRAMIRGIVEGGADQMGQVMGQLMPKIRGRYDGGAANALVQDELQQPSQG